MDILNEALEFVNKQIAFHKTKAEEFAPSNSRRAQHHAKTADGMTEVANLLTKQSVDIKGGLIERIGLPRVEALEADYSVKKWDKDEVRAIRDEYRAKARELKREAA